MHKDSHKTSMQHIKRKDYLDTACGLLIIHMIVGHCCIFSGISLEYETATMALNLFMPWFFFKSGMMWRESSLKVLTSKVWHRLIVPYITVTAICLFFEFVYRTIYIETPAIGEFLLSQGRLILKDGAIFCNAPLWFLTSLAAVKLIYGIAQKLGNFGHIIIISTCLIGIYIDGFINISATPLYVRNIPLGLIFYSLGHLLGETPCVGKKASILLTACYLTLLCMMPTLFDFHKALLYFGNYWLYFPIALLGIVSINTLLKNFYDRQCLLSYIGRCSMPYFILHWPIILAIRALFVIIGQPTSGSIVFLVTLLCVEAILLPTLTLLIEKCRLGFIIGKREQTRQTPAYRYREPTDDSIAPTTIINDILHHIHYHRRDITNTIIRALSLLAISFCFIAGLADISSPFKPNWGNDYGIFVTFGDCWLNGEVIFRDKFDNKGPYHFLIQAVGVWLGRDKVGIYVLESINLAACLYLLYLTGRLFKARATRIYFGIFAFLAMLALTICGGNTVEEWSVPFQLLSLWLCLKHITSGEKRHPYSYSFIYGLCFGIVALMRINDNAIIVGIVLGMAYLLIRRREYTNLVLNALWLVIGFIVALLPAIIYFWYHSALYDMVYATFIYNIKYREVWETDTSIRLLRNACRMLVCLFAIITSICYDHKYHTQVAPVVIGLSAVTFLTFLPGAIYPHYFIMVCPIVFLLCVLSVSVNKWCQALILALCLWPLSQDWYLQNDVLRKFGIIRDNYSEPTPEQIFSERFTEVPTADMDSIYLYAIPYTYQDMLYRVGHRPIGKYFTQQERVSLVDPYIYDDVRADFTRTRAKWVIAGKKFDDTIVSDLTASYVLTDSCRLSCPKETIYLYQRTTN